LILHLCMYVLLSKLPNASCLQTSARRATIVTALLLLKNKSAFKFAKRNEGSNMHSITCVRLKWTSLEILFGPHDWKVEKHNKCHFFLTSYLPLRQFRPRYFKLYFKLLSLSVFQSREKNIFLWIQTWKALKVLAL
jgi:hypothetical protein